MTGTAHSHVFCFGLLQQTDVRVGVFPELQETAIEPDALVDLWISRLARLRTMRAFARNLL